MKTGEPVQWQRTAWPTNSLRLDPELRLCSQCDSTTIRMFPLAHWSCMGFQVLDDICMEHIQ